MAKKLTDEQMVAAKAAMEAGTPLMKYLKDNNIDVPPFVANRNLYKKYGQGLMTSMRKVKKDENALYTLSNFAKRRIAQLKLKGAAKTKFKNDLKSLIDEL
jgi:hypothetical protein